MKTIILLAPLLASLSAAQTILVYGSGDLPSCASTCTTLTIAQDGCIPPAAPVSDQSIYVSCFCQSAFLTGLSTDASTICNTTCTDQTDRTEIQSWFNTLCTTPVSTSSTSAASSTAAATTATSAATTVTGVSAATSTLDTSLAGAANTNTSSSGAAWWHAHSRWIAMAIVLIVGFTFIGVLGMFLKRRSTRRHQREAALAPPVVWGPHQNQHYTGGTGYNSASAAAIPQSEMVGKGKGRATNVLPTASRAPVNYSEKDGFAKEKKAGWLGKLFLKS